jgi:predicted dehydrogenase
MTTAEHRESRRKAIPRVAVIGCGAAAREFCLPVLAKYPDFRRSIVLVDKTASQAASVATEFGIQHHCTDYRSLPFEVEAAIVTTPHHLHAEQSIHFLRQGKPVFAEKPLGMSSAEVSQMLEAATMGGATLMVNNCRRLFPAYRRVRDLLCSGEYGAIVNVRISDGSPFEWNSVSDFYLRNPPQAKGVFLDRGAHTVDVVCWWLSGRPQVIDARSDALGGAEALLKVQMALGKTTVELAFSRLYKLENCFTVECENATISGRLFNSTKFEIQRNGRTESIQAGKPAQYHEYAWQLLENFIEVVQGIAPPLFTAADVAPSIALIDETYQQATTFDLPWYENDPNLALLRSQAMTHNS